MCRKSQKLLPLYLSLEIDMYAILYETGESGAYLGAYSEFEDAENRFMKIADDLLESVKNHKSGDYDSFFEMYGVFDAPSFGTDYEPYRIATHKCQILNYKLIYQLREFCLYVVEIEGKFSPVNLKRAQNHFYIRKSKHIERSIMLIMN